MSATLCVLAGVALAGCALGRDTVDVAAPTSVAPTSISANMTPVKIVSVADNRAFEVKPRDPSTPSLENANDIGNPAITTRAFARKRGGFGGAFGDIVLPEGHTVADLVKAVTEKALREKGYRVVDASSRDYATAVPVGVDIQELWAWFTPGAFTVTVECKATVKVSGETIFVSSPAVIEGYASNDSIAATDSVYADSLTRALDDLTAKMAAQIK